jgi:hypothetical protein
LNQGIFFETSDDVMDLTADESPVNSPILADREYALLLSHQKNLNS